MYLPNFQYELIFAKKKKEYYIIINRFEIRLNILKILLFFGKIIILFK